MTESTPVLLHPDQIDQLRRLLATMEDWLLHASVDTLDELGGFLAGLAWSTAPPDQLAATLVAELGEHTVALRHPTHTQGPA